LNRFIENQDKLLKQKAPKGALVCQEDSIKHRRQTEETADKSSVSRLSTRTKLQDENYCYRVVS